MFIGIKKMIKKLIVKKVMSEKEIEDKEGTFFNDDGIKIFDKDVDIYKEDGSLLLKFRKNVITEEQCKKLTVFEKVVGSSRRLSASGIPIKSQKSQYKLVKSKKTGKLYKSIPNVKKINSGIIGFYDNSSNFHSSREKDKNNKQVKCRQTAFTAQNYDKFKNCLGVFKKIDRIYKKLVPKYYKIQKDAIDTIDPEFVIKDTIFTTVTVNRNFRTALHRDYGDFRQGFGNLVIVSEGDYEGGYTMFPQYGVGVDCRGGDFIAMDVHEWHCNSEIKGEGKRFSFVFYLREKMLKSCPNE